MHCELFLGLDRKLNSHYIKKGILFLSFSLPICQILILSFLIKDSWVKISFFLLSVQESFGVECKIPGYLNQSDSAILTSDEFACFTNILSRKMNWLFSQTSTHTRHLLVCSMKKRFWLLASGKPTLLRLIINITLLPNLFQNKDESWSALSRDQWKNWC